MTSHERTINPEQLSWIIKALQRHKDFTQEVVPQPAGQVNYIDRVPDDVFYQHIVRPLLASSENQTVNRHVFNSSLGRYVYRKGVCI
jgi:hypothetical protein